MPQSWQSTQAPAGSGLLTATVPREFVRRAAVAEILLTGRTRTGADRFTMTAQWPRADRLHVSPDRSACEPFLIAETVRQGGALLAHAAYQVPLDHQFVDITVTQVRRRAGRPAALRYDAVVRLGGERVATGRIAGNWTNESVYRRLRGGRTADVGALRLPRPLLSPAAARVDTAHPVFFGHPLDHIPGMLLLEAARQAALAHGGRERRVPVPFHAGFHQFAEFDRPVWTEVSEAAGADVQVVALQGESVAFECRVSAVAG